MHSARWYKEGAVAQVVRVCEYSFVLATSIPCNYNGPHNAQSLAIGVVESNSELTLTCPDALDHNEAGGRLSLYDASLMPGDFIAHDYNIES